MSLTDVIRENFTNGKLDLGFQGFRASLLAFKALQVSEKQQRNLMQSCHVYLNELTDVPCTLRLHHRPCCMVV